ncbi:MAG: hypothetical protein LH468_00135 [Nocardioides sp.]|nr:hypothetical protein [Nocardioides sp.]
MGDSQDAEHESAPHDAPPAYSLLAGQRRREQRRVDEVDARLEAIIGAFEQQVVAGLERVVARLDLADGRLVGVSARLDEIEERLTGRLEDLEGSVAALLRRLPAES